MGFFNSLMTSTQIKNAISIAESFLDNYDTYAGYQVKKKVIDNLKKLDGSDFAENLESEALALNEILETAGDMYAYVPDDPLEMSPPYDALMKLIIDVSERMQKLGYMTKKQSSDTISRIESNYDKSSLANRVKMMNSIGLKHSSQKKN